MRQMRRGIGAILPAAFILSLAAAMAAPAVAMAASGGDSNRGDVWLDNVGQPAGPGHEMDPHLACADINLWGANMGDSAGTYIIDGWPPSGHMEQDYPPSGKATWHYSGGKQPQVISVISVRTLIADAVANGDTAAHQGYHFKLQLSQDPQKHKTFWVNCPAPSPVGGGNTGGSTGGGVSGTITGSGNHNIPAVGGTSAGAGDTAGVAGVTTSGSQPANLATTGEGIVLPIAALLLGLVLLLGGLTAVARPLPVRR